MIDLSSLESFIFPQTKTLLERSETKNGITSNGNVEHPTFTKNDSNQKTSELDPSSLNKFSITEFRSIIQPSMGRRDAVVGENIVPDPTYWFSPQRFKVEKPEETLQILRENILATHPWFSTLDPFIKMLLEDAFQFCVFQQDDVVTSPGEDAAFCFVVRGSIELVPQHLMAIRNKNPRASSWLHRRTRIRKRPGEDFGREGLLHKLEGPRFSYTSIALLPAAVFRLGRTEYQKILMVSNLEPHMLLTGTLNYVRVFDSFSDAERSKIAKAVKSVNFRKGDVILRAGSIPDSLYIIEEGAVEVLRSVPNSGAVQVKLLVHSECVGDAEIFSWDNKSQYEYVAYEDVKALQLDQDFLYKFHGNPLLQHLFSRINTAEIANRKRLIKEVVEIDSRSVVDSSDSDLDYEGASSLLLKKKSYSDDCGEGNTSEDDELEIISSDDEDLYVVDIKTPETTQFLINRFFTRREYGRADGVQRGIALTAFSSPRHIKAGTVLFRAEPDVQPGENKAIARARRLRMRKCDHLLDSSEQFLYVVQSGSIDLLDREGRVITTFSEGESVGEHRLLKKISSPCEVTAVVSSTEGCSILRLPRKIFRYALLSSYVAEYEHLKEMLCSFSYLSGFPEANMLVMHHKMERTDLGNTSLILAENVTPCFVFILCDGVVRIQSSHTSELHYVQKGDPIGGIEVVLGVLSRAAYITEGHATVLKIKASDFPSVFYYGIPFVDFLRKTSRFRRFYGSGWKEKPLALEDKS